MQTTTTISLRLILLLLFPLQSFTQTVGLISNQPSSSDGYVLFAPLPSDTTYLIDKCGRKVHSWVSAYHPGDAVYLSEDGNLLHTCNVNSTVFTSGGKGGRLEIIDWNSNITWSYLLSSATQCQHHDAIMLPNGNVLAIVWDLKTPAEALASGRDPAKTGTSLWSEKILELQPSGTSSAIIVWEWYLWDHLIQDFDSTKANYGVTDQHPELLNLNFVDGNPTASDWIHMNAIDYNAELDHILFSSHNLSEIYIIDHSTTTAEAATHAGGNSGKGGDFLYRWGNPESYNHGTSADKKLFGQHNPHWIKSGLVDEGKIMIFNNGLQRPGSQYSTIDVITQPVDSTGNYIYTTGMPYQPDSASWQYIAPNPTDFFAQNISGAQRLADGHTLICDGPEGKFFEIDSMKNIVWEYISPVANNILSQGATPVGNSVFRCTQYDAAYPGFNGQTLTPGNPIELNPLPSSCTTTALENLPDVNPFAIVNPASTTLQVIPSIDLDDVAIYIFDLNGRKILEWNNMDLQKDNPVSLPVSKLNNGLYFVRIVSDSKSFQERFIKMD